MSDMLFGDNFGGNNSKKKLQKPSKRSGDLLFKGKPIEQTIPADSVADVEFTAELTDPDQYDEIQFTDTTNVAVEWHWDFGDGFTSHEQNPTHVYPGGAGTNYTVTLIVKDSKGRVGIAVKQDYIQIQNDKYINEKLSGTQFLISFTSKIDPNQTKWAEVRDSSNNNLYTIGFNNDQPDINAIQNNVSGTPYIRSFYDTDDQLLCTEGTANAQYNFDINNFKGSFDATVSRDLGFYDFDKGDYAVDSPPLYIGVVYERIGGNYIGFLDTDKNAQNGSPLAIGQTSFVNTGIVRDAANTTKQTNTKYLVELYVYGNTTVIIVNGQSSYNSGGSNDSGSSHALHSRILSSNDYVHEILFSNDPAADRGKFVAYALNKHGNDIDFQK